MVHFQSGEQILTQYEISCVKDIIQAPPIESLGLVGSTQYFSVLCPRPGILQHLETYDKWHLDMPTLQDILEFSSSLESFDFKLPEFIVIRESIGIILLQLHSLVLMGPLDNI